MNTHAAGQPLLLRHLVLNPHPALPPHSTQPLSTLPAADECLISYLLILMRVMTWLWRNFELCCATCAPLPLSRARC